MPLPTWRLKVTVQRRPFQCSMSAAALRRPTSTHFPAAQTSERDTTVTPSKNGVHPGVRGLALMLHLRPSQCSMSVPTAQTLAGDAAATARRPRLAEVARKLAARTGRRSARSHDCRPGPRPAAGWRPRRSTRRERTPSLPPLPGQRRNRQSLGFLGASRPWCTPPIWIEHKWRLVLWNANSGLVADEAVETT